jgi:thiol-disulfide isomerase/thioredoxin
MPDHDFDYLLRVGNNEVFSYLIERKPGDVETTRSVIPMPGDVAPDLSLLDITTSRPIHLRDFKGKLLVLDFWATWCEPCQESIGNLELVAKAHPEWRQSVNFVTVSIDEKPEAVQPHLDKKGWGHAGIHYTWFGPGEPSARGGPYGASGVPTTVIIGADGKIVDPCWYSSEPKMEQHIEELLKKQAR